MVNKIAGNRFEAELCGILAEHGFWAHNMAQNQAGQPADIIAVKDGWAVLIDCKLCSGNASLSPVLNRIRRRLWTSGTPAATATPGLR